MEKGICFIYLNAYFVKSLSQDTAKNCVGAIIYKSIEACPLFKEVV